MREERVEEFLALVVGHSNDLPGVLLADVKDRLTGSGVGERNGLTGPRRTLDLREEDVTHVTPEADLTCGKDDLFALDPGSQILGECLVGPDRAHKVRRCHRWLSSSVA